MRTELTVDLKEDFKIEMKIKINAPDCVLVIYNSLSYPALYKVGGDWFHAPPPPLHRHNFVTCNIKPLWLHTFLLNDNYYLQ